MIRFPAKSIALVLLILAAPTVVLAVQPPDWDACRVTLNGRPAPLPTADMLGCSLIVPSEGPQVALWSACQTLTVDLAPDEELTWSVPWPAGAARGELQAEIVVQRGAGEIVFGAGKTKRDVPVVGPAKRLIRTEHVNHDRSDRVVLHIKARDPGLVVRCRHLSLHDSDRIVPVAFVPEGRHPCPIPAPSLPPLRRAIEQALVEWDWRLQDGIGTERESRSFQEATLVALQRGDALLAQWPRDVPMADGLANRWREASDRWHAFSEQKDGDADWEGLWREIHQLRRQLVLQYARLADTPLVFAKQPHSSFSHQLTQYLGRYARPGGGLFVLEEPGRSMHCRSLAAELPAGSFQHPTVSYDGRRIVFAYCPVDEPPAPGLAGQGTEHFHLYEVGVDGTGLRRVTDGPFDDFSPAYLPDERIVFISTRRGGWHRCGGRPGQGCENHTLAIVEADGSNPRPISLHETQEWDPAVLPDGRIVYTRWDYVDRHAVYYEQLWSTQPDGTGAVAFYGNNTLNPVGLWEARPVPGSHKVMATAAAHHAMTAGSIVLVDVLKGIDGLQSLTRLTPEVPFPESEQAVPPRNWHAPAGVHELPSLLPEARRWPGHSYKSPYPLSEDVFLVSYSFLPLVGEPDPNVPNMYGLYVADRFGNKELLYRDPSISSLWPQPIEPRPRPFQAGPRPLTAADEPSGTIFIQNVYDATPSIPTGSVKAVRVLQVLPKSTPGINWPRIGLANASPGKQVLGTAPVATDGSACFRVPSDVPVSLQILDERGRAIQVMRSLVYLKQGEVLACAGCHEQRQSAPASGSIAQALRREPSPLQAPPEGANPFSYPRLVQPVLDRHCVECHNSERADGGIVLTGQPEGAFTKSYNALAPRVSFSAWGGKPGDFRVVNSEPLSKPDFFGARGSSLMRLLDEGHEGVSLNDDEWERLITWMDANALFYGTFNHEDQKRQLRGERIAGPDLQ